MKRKDIKSILLIGSGPIVIGQACEFDYSGTQALKALKADGYRTILVNSNPATIMTDPELADATYVEPLTPEILEQIIAKERPDALLPTLGGQTGLNLAISLDRLGVLKKYSVELLGADIEVIHRAEDRQAFKQAMKEIDIATARSGVARTLEEAHTIADKLGYPCVVRPAFTLGGTGGGVIYSPEELNQIAASGLRDSIISEVLIEESLLGWKEYELEVMRDRKDNVVIVCSIENIDPMGIHTGDSITVAPALTLSDREYQYLRNASVAIMRKIGVETGGSNVQFAVNPQDGRVVVIEMNPRVSRSSALASKATGFPIAKFAAKLAVGYTLDEIDNDITQETKACFEPVIDYIVTKIPRFNFDKFLESTPELGTEMRAVGEVMAIGRTFKESFQKALRSLEFKPTKSGSKPREIAELTKLLASTHPERIFYIQEAFQQGMELETIHSLSRVDHFFLHQIQDILTHSKEFQLDADHLKSAKEMGFSDQQLAKIANKTPQELRSIRKSQGIVPVYKFVDTCAGEFEARTPYYYSTYESEHDCIQESPRKKVMIIGSGPNRIGQGIEFDYCCVHAASTLKEIGLSSIMVNSNPETVSTDFDVADKLYFEPLTFEDIMNIYEHEKPYGMIIQLGGQTPLNLTQQLYDAGVNILGTRPEQIARAEDRALFKEILSKLGLNQPQNKMVGSKKAAKLAIEELKLPVILRPSYVIGGSGMATCRTNQELNDYFTQNTVSKSHPVLIEQFLDKAIEVDVDAISDGEDCVIAGIMEHVERVGVHSGDSASILPPHTLSDAIINELKKITTALAIELKVVGLINVQYAIKGDSIYVIEANPRGSRSLPFVCKATGVNWVALACKLMIGFKIFTLGIREKSMPYYAVKETVFPFKKFKAADPILGPQMLSTGEVMGTGDTPHTAFYKAQLAALQPLPKKGQVAIFYTPQSEMKKGQLSKRLEELNMQAIEFTEDSTDADIEASVHNQQFQLLLSFSGQQASAKEKALRRKSIQHNIPIITQFESANMSLECMSKMKNRSLEVHSLQELYKTSELLC